MLVAGGYPEAYQKGKAISVVQNIEDSIIFHAGTKKENDNVVSNGGRVMAVTSLGDSIEEALEKTYATIEKIQFEDMNYRKDIGFDLI